MSSPLESYYAELEEPKRSAFLYIRSHLLSGADMTESWKWKLPFFDYKGKYFCYLWQDKKSPLPYLAFTQGKKLDHPALHFGERKQIGVILFDPSEDLPIELIDEVVALAKAVYD